jgi:hypothetical protein
MVTVTALGKHQPLYGDCHSPKGPATGFTLQASSLSVRLPWAIHTCGCLGPLRTQMDPAPAQRPSFYTSSPLCSLLWHLSQDVLSCHLMGYSDL